jgi:acyl-CoA synthetase (NDP forming)
VVDVAFDIVSTPSYLDTVERREQQAESRSIARLLRPRAIAIVGASDRPASVGQTLLQHLGRGGFRGPVYPVNPAHARIGELTCYPTLTAVPDDVALAIVAVPPDRMDAVLEDAIEKHVRGLILVTGDLPPAPPGEASAVEQLVARARGNGMRVIGPASMGVVVTDPEAPLQAVLAPTRIAPGGVAVSLQSGSLGTGILELASRLGVGLSTFVSLGDKADVSGNDLLQFFEDDPATKVVLVYTESFGNPRKFARIARRVSRTKPIVAVRAGGSSDPLTEALYEQAGVIRVRTVRELLDTARVLDGLPLPHGDRVMIVANAGSPALLALDAAVQEGLVPAELPPGDADALLAGLPTGAVVQPGAVQLTHRATPADFGHVVRALLDADSVDALVVIFAPPLPDLTTLPISTLRAFEDGLAKPLLAVLVGLDDGPLGPGSRLPVFAFPEPALAVLGRVVRHVAARRDLPAVQPPRPDGIDDERAQAVIERALATDPGGATLALPAAHELLAAYGIGVADGRAVSTLESALVAADEVGYPVVLKTASIARTGRSERAGVALDLHDPTELGRAWQAIEAELGPGALDRSVVQRMVPPGVELRLLVQQHPLLGPVVTFGLGGILADAIGDRVHRLAPFAHDEAAAMIAASRASFALEDRAARASAQDLLERVARLADDRDEVDGLTINPALASREGAWVTDVVMRVRPAPGDADTDVRRLSSPGPRERGPDRL